MTDDLQHQLPVSAVYQHCESPDIATGGDQPVWSASSSVYHGMTVSLHKRMSGGLGFRVAYTWAHAIDNVQDALVAGAPATVRNSYSTKSERASSVTDQRQRLTISAIEEPNPFAAGQKFLAAMFQSLENIGDHDLWQRTPGERYGVGRSEPGREHEQ